ncbi:MAG TPA: M20/M25/M40 family metallo-hydrolase [Candidatus Binatia bacterium]|jgi:acetylornithine deacetylase/succinyl-diaminopimelate desuccinylase-like protein
MNLRKPFNPFAVVLVILATIARGYAAEGKLDWKALEEEAVSTLSRYIQIDTTNPPGNEIKAAQFFKEIFDRAEIEARIIESAPGRGNIFARLRGNGTKKALVLLNHMDVVPADPKEWKEPPFSGLIKDGQIWGRGALDNKGPAVAELLTLLALKRQNIPLKGDVIFLGTADEEAGGAMGAGYLLENHPELFADVGLVLNEGGGIRLGTDGKAREYSVSVTEKTPLWLRLTARGQPGHGSTPGSNLAVNKLIAALQRVTQYRAPMRVVPEVQKFYAETAYAAPAEQRQRYLDLRASLQDQAFAAEFTKDSRNNASVRNTIAITVIKASEKTNVIPAEATAELDVRLLPGEDPQTFIEELKKIIADDSIKIEIILSFPPATSPPHPEAMRIINEMAKGNDGGVAIVSPLVRGFTDCHFFREKGMPCFGFMPLRNSPSQGGMVHGIDERITIESLRAGLRGMYELVHRLAAQ